MFSFRFMMISLGDYLLPTVLALCTTVSALAGVPNTLTKTVYSPLTGINTGANQGAAVAVDGDITAVSVPNDSSAASNAGVVKVYRTSSGELLYVLPNPNPGVDDRFATSLAVLGTRIVVGTYADDSTAVDSGSVYIFDLTSATPTMPVMQLTNPDAATATYFGNSVGISGNLIVVGAPGDSNGAFRAGSAYVYDLSSATPSIARWTIRNPAPGNSDYFGYAVAISGQRVVVGAFKDSGISPQAGSAYVYNLSSANPTVPAVILTKPGTSGSVLFGCAVAISGTRVVIGAYQDYTGSVASSGSAFVYDLAGGAPTIPVVTLTNPTPASGDYFGYAVAMDGNRVVVGAYLDDTVGTDSGIAYVYDLDGATPATPLVTLNRPAAVANGDQFGTSVAISGALVVIGAPGVSEGDSHTGSAYAYDMGGATPTVTLAVMNTLSFAGNAKFGRSVAVSGSRMVAGASDSDTNLSGAGSAYVNDLAGGATVPLYVLNNPQPVANDGFGVAVAMSGNIVAVSSFTHLNANGSKGMVCLYDLGGAAPNVPFLTLTNPGNGYGGFGYSLAMTGTHVVVAAPFDASTGANSGRAYVFAYTSPTPNVPVATLENPTPAVNDYFGDSVAISETRVVVGADRDDTGATDAGSVYIYEMASANPATPVVTLHNPVPHTGDVFGRSVAISGTRVVVGSPSENPAFYYPSVYVFDIATASPTVPVATLRNTGNSSKFTKSYGAAVAISGTRIMVGEPTYDGGNVGHVFAFDLASATPTTPVATLENPYPVIRYEFGYAIAMDGSSAVIGRPSLNNIYEGGKTALCVYRTATDLDGDGLLDSWEVANFGTTIGHGALDDQDGDGLTELEEEAFGLNPRNPMPAAARLL